MSDTNLGQYYADLNPDGTAKGFYVDLVNGTNIPQDAIKISVDQWRLWIHNFNGLRWQDNELVAFTPPDPPQPTIQQQATTLLENPIVTVSCTSIPDLNGDYAADNATRGNITGIALGINSGLGLPSGESTFIYPDIHQNPHSWPADQFILFAKGVMAYIYQLSLTASSNNDALPSSTITIP